MAPVTTSLASNAAGISNLARNLKLCRASRAEFRKLLRVARQPAVARATTSCPRALKNRIALEVAWSRLALTEPALASVAAIRESGARCKYGVGATLRLQLL